MPPPPRPPTSLPSQLQSALSQSTSTPLPSLPWLTTLTSARSPPPPLASLLATARARILAADLTTPNLLDPTYASTHCFPPNLHNPHTESCSLPSDAIVQVLDVENLSKSRWEQVEELESQARGETKRGREIIRVTNDEEGRDGNNIDRGQIQANTQATQAQGERGGTAGNKNATHKLLLQDCKGQKVYGLELERVDKIGVGITSIGEKVLLKKGTKAARGVLLLEPGGCVVLGGRVGVWDAAWNEGRLERLK
ncbi:RecQ-mediated genome instability protein 1, partial [Cladorrhinum sp. PSN332]